jgi:cytochrome oxidase assembly protein ShyY1
VYRFLARPRWIGFAVLVVLTILGCLLLARWQWSRLDEREAKNAVVNQNIDQPAVSVSELLTPGAPLPASDEWRSVTARGEYDPDSTLLVRKRFYNGSTGLYVLTAVRGADGAALWVNRGWVPAGASARSDVTVPPTPEGEVTVTARMRQPEPASGRSTTGVPEGQIDRMDAATMTAAVDYPVYGGYGEVVAEEPAPPVAPEPIAAPDLGDGPHLSYAVQWVTFAFVAIIGWYVLIRKEAERLGEERAAQAAAAGGPDPEPLPTPTVPDVQTDPRTTAAPPLEGNH